MTPFEISYVILWVLVCTLLIGVAALYSAVGALVGERAKTRLPFDFGGPAIGSRLELPSIRDLRGRLVPGAKRWIFVSPNCASCDRARDYVAGEPGDAGRTAVVCRDTADSATRWAAGLPDSVPVIADEHGEIFAAFNIDATPFHVLLDDQGRCVASGPTESALQRPTGALAVLTRDTPIGGKSRDGQCI